MDMKTVIQRATGHYVVSTVDTYDRGLETMVFACKPDGEVTSYADLACDRYDSESEARAGHQRMVENFVYDPSAKPTWGY